MGLQPPPGKYTAAGYRQSAQGSFSTLRGVLHLLVFRNIATSKCACG